MRIKCPHCGERGNEEFAYLGDATVHRPDDAPAATPADPAFARWMDYVYLRDNPAGAHRELWQHIHGCRSWIVVTREHLDPRDPRRRGCPRGGIARPAVAGAS